MKKTFVLNHPKIKVERQVDSIKHELKKYVRRERNKQLPRGVDYWDFDCKYGPTAEEAQSVPLSQLNKSIDAGNTEEGASFYIEIMAKHGIRVAKDEDFEDDYDDEDFE